MTDAVLVIPLRSWVVWAEAYAAVGALVWIGFIVYQLGWGFPEERFGPGKQALRLVATGFVIGALWPVWAAVGALFLFAAASSPW